MATITVGVSAEVPGERHKPYAKFLVSDAGKGVQSSFATKMHEVEEHIHEVDSLKNGRVSDETKKVALMTLFVEDQAVGVPQY